MSIYESDWWVILWLQFRAIAAADFVKQNLWPELVPNLQSAIQNSHLTSGSNTKWSTVNALLVLHALLRPFQVLKFLISLCLWDFGFFVSLAYCVVLKYFFSSINCFYETLYVFDAVWLWRVQIVNLTFTTFNQFKAKDK